MILEDEEAVQRQKGSGDDGNENGNPHLDTGRILELWRKSVDRQTRRQWLVVDPADKDRAVEVPDPSRILPRNIRIVPRAVTAQAADTDASESR